MPGFKCGYCHDRHDTVDQVKACAKAAHPQATAKRTDPTKVTNPASPAQVSYIESLLAARPAYRDVMNLWSEHIAKLTKPEASSLIDTIKAECPQPEASDQPKSEEDLLALVGVYVLPDGRIVQVKPNKAKTRVYGKLWVDINGERLTLAGTRVKGEWLFVKGLVDEVKPEHKMNVDQAKAFILLYGQCARCARRLKAAKSVEAGIGPVCIKYFGGALAA